MINKISKDALAHFGGAATGKADAIEHAAQIPGQGQALEAGDGAPVRRTGGIPQGKEGAEAGRGFGAELLPRAIPPAPRAFDAHAQPTKLASPGGHIMGLAIVSFRRRDLAEQGWPGPVQSLGYRLDQLTRH